MEVEGFNFPYVWSPCDGFNCSSGKVESDCALCQKPYNFSCGTKSNPVWIWDTEYSNNQFPNWRIEYTFGDTWR